MGEMRSYKILYLSLIHIYAFVYNDFLCQTQERAVVMTKPDKENRRPFPNSIRHLIPGYWRYFNFPDVFYRGREATS